MYVSEFNGKNHIEMMKTFSLVLHKFHNRKCDVINSFACDPIMQEFN